MANVTINATTVLEAINLTVAEITAIKVEKYIDRAISTIENATGHSIGELTGDAGTKSISVDKKFDAAIVDLSAIYCIVHMTGGKAVGLSFSLGDVRVDALERTPPIQLLNAEVRRNIEALKKKYFGKSSASGWMC